MLDRALRENSLTKDTRQIKQWVEVLITKQIIQSVVDDADEQGNLQLGCHDNSSNVDEQGNLQLGCHDNSSNVHEQGTQNWDNIITRATFILFLSALQMRAGDNSETSMAEGAHLSHLP